MWYQKSQPLLWYRLWGFRSLPVRPFFSPPHISFCLILRPKLTNYRSCWLSSEKKPDFWTSWWLLSLTWVCHGISTLKTSGTYRSVSSLKNVPTISSGGPPQLQNIELHHRSAPGLLQLSLDFLNSRAMPNKTSKSSSSTKIDTISASQINTTKRYCKNATHLPQFRRKVCFPVSPVINPPCDSGAKLRPGDLSRIFASVTTLAGHIRRVLSASVDVPPLMCRLQASFRAEDFSQYFAASSRPSTIRWSTMQDRIAELCESRFPVSEVYGRLEFSMASWT